MIVKSNAWYTVNAQTRRQLYIFCGKFLLKFSQQTKQMEQLSHLGLDKKSFNVYVCVLTIISLKFVPER